MDAANTNGSEIWSEVYASAGLCGVLALCSATLSGKDTDEIKFVNNFAVANNYVRPAMRNRVVAILRKALTQTSGAAD